MAFPNGNRRRPYELRLENRLLRGHLVEIQLRAALREQFACWVEVLHRQRVIHREDCARLLHDDRPVTASQSGFGLVKKQVDLALNGSLGMSAAS